MRMFVLFLLMALPPCALMLNGCAGMGLDMEDPVITIVDLRPGEVKALETVFYLELRVINPNDFPLDVNGLNCELNIDDRRFASGISNVQTRVPAYGTATVPVTVYASMFEMVGSVLDLLRDADLGNGPLEPLDYELSGNVRLRGHGSVSFDSEGSLDLTGRP